MWKAHPEQGTHLDFIAQDVQPVLPETVSVGDDSNHTLGLTYTEFIPVIVRAIQQLAARLSDLATTIAGFADRFTTKELFFDRATGNEMVVQKMCVQKTDGTAVCVDGDQLAAVLGLAGQSPTPTSPSAGSTAASTPTSPVSPPQASSTSAKPPPTETGTSTTATSSPPLAPEEPEPTPATTTAPDNSTPESAPTSDISAEPTFAP